MVFVRIPSFLYCTTRGCVRGEELYDITLVKFDITLVKFHLFSFHFPVIIVCK